VTLLSRDLCLSFMAASYYFYKILALTYSSVFGLKGSITVFAALRSAVTNIYLLIKSLKYWPLVALINIYSLGWL